MSSAAGIEIEALDQDITEIEVDAIVNSGNTHMYLGGGKSVAGTIDAKTGGKVQEELFRIVKPPVRVGDVVVTGSFGLPCKHILHLATHGTVEELKESGLDPDAYRLRCISSGVENVLRKAKELGLNTLAIPLIAAGTLQLPLEMAVETLVNAANDSLQKLSISRMRLLLVSFKNQRALSLLKGAIKQLPLNTTTEADHNRAEEVFHISNRVVAGPVTAGLGLEGGGAVAGVHVFNILKNKSSDAPPETLHFDEFNRLARNLLEARLTIANLEEKCRIADEEIRKLREANGGSRDFPLPLAYAYDMVKSELSPTLQMERLRRAIGIVIRYYGSIVMADYLAAGAPDQDLNRMCKGAFARPVTDGTWLQIIQAAAKSYRTFDLRPKAIKEILTLWADKSYVGRWLGLIQLRNQVHEAISVDETTAKDWLAKALPNWEKMFQKSSDLNQYGLLFLEALEDFADDKIVYHIKWIMGEHLIPRSERVIWEQKLKKGKLYLRDKSSGKCLDLSPFMAYEYSEITRTRETYCIEQIIQGRIVFSTIRFAHRVELPNHPPPFQT